MRKKSFPSVFMLVSVVSAILTWRTMSVHARPGEGTKVEEQRRIFHSLEEVMLASNERQLLIFFSLACPVCWEELFEMKEFIKNYSIPVGLVAIAKDSPEELKRFAARYSFPYPIVCDDQKKLYRRFRVKLEPYRLLLDRDRILCQDDMDDDFLARREKIKRCLLEMASK